MSDGTRTRFYADIMGFHQEVTGSLIPVVVNFPNGKTTKFIVDCGLFQEKEYGDKNYKLPFCVSELDFVLVTHNHVDHTGRLPYLVKKGYKNSIYMTTETSYLIPLALDDSCKVLEDNARQKNLPSLYEKSHVDETLRRIVPCDYNKVIQVTPNIKVTFFMNGHLPGAAVILVRIYFPNYKTINLLFTGDYNNKNMFFDVCPIPKWVRKLPITVVQESTYGSITSEETNKKCFENNVLEAISNNKTVICLVFSLGRSQEILYTIKKMQDDGRLDKSIPIFFDGKLAFKYTNIYLSGKLNIKKCMENFLPESLIYVDSDWRQIILSNNKPKIIVTTSGMGSYGPAQTYLPVYLTKKNALIHFTGYTAEGTLGFKLKNTPKGDVVETGGLFLMKMADVEYTSEYSAHAKQDELLDFLKQFEDLKMVLINHGEKETQKIYANKVLKEVDTKYVGVLGNEHTFRVDHYGFVKTIGTEFE